MLDSAKRLGEAVSSVPEACASIRAKVGDRLGPIDPLAASLKTALPPRKVMARLMILMVMVGMFTGSAAADGHCPDSSGLDCLEKQIKGIGDFIILVIIAVAVPNGAYGFFEWMTAGSSVEQNEQGRKRIRNTFIALGGAGVIKIAVTAVSGMTGARSIADSAGNSTASGGGMITAPIEGGLL